MFDKNYIEKVKEEKQKWEKIYESLKEREVKFVTNSEIPNKILYTPLNLKEKDGVNKEGTFFFSFLLT